MLSETLIEGLEAYRIGAKIRALRASKSMGLAQLGAHAGLSAGMLSKLERGQVVPTLPTLMRVAMVFGVGLDHFFQPGETAPLVELVRAQERMTLPNVREGDVTYRFASLDYTVRGRRTEAFLAEFPKGAPESEAHEHDGVEMIHVTRGWLELTIHRRTHRLEAGDTLTFDAGFPHSYCGEGQALVTLRPEI
ncbi:cupin domain-containing protein [Aliiroseovarius sp.]|uniref:helix-turn-helix domain-containing protein n=1 Tax=Aliiroseovarius sp. TaxID=1872442 RepID=UPI00262DB73C|nr:cupin domain-containing protein [Aliiroseovarius sp.]